jgi:hypothetical protein
MARPQEATACRYRGQLPIYGTTVVDNQQRVVLQLGGWSGGLTIPHRKTPDLLRNRNESLGPRRILWQNDASTVKWTSDLAPGMLALQAGSPSTYSPSVITLPSLGPS